MTRHEIVLRRLGQLSRAEVTEAIRQLTCHVELRLRFKRRGDRTKTGAHSEINLGMDAVSYYVGEAYKAILEPDRWDWKFEERTLGEQLCRIANKLMSDVVVSWVCKRDGLPTFDNRDASEIPELAAIADSDRHDHEKMCKEALNLAYSVSEEDEDLTEFCLRYFESKEYDIIADEMNITIKQVHVLRKKLVRRMIASEHKIKME